MVGIEIIYLYGDNVPFRGFRTKIIPHSIILFGLSGRCSLKNFLNYFQKSTHLLDRQVTSYLGPLNNME